MRDTCYLLFTNNRSLLLLSVYDWTPFSLTDDNVGGAPDGRPTEPGVTPGVPFGLVVAGWALSA